MTAEGKSPDALRTISEVADELDLPQHVLRFWESKFGQVKPMKRGGNRRYYRPEDLDLLRGIRQLLYGDGYTIKGVQRILKEQGTGPVIAVGQGASSGDVTQVPADGNDEGEAAAQPAAASAASVDRERLKRILEELEACRSLLKSAETDPV